MQKKREETKRKKNKPTSRLKPEWLPSSAPPDSDPTILSPPNSNIVDFQKCQQHIQFHGPHLVCHKMDEVQRVKDYVNGNENGGADSEQERMTRL